MKGISFVFIPLLTISIYQISCVTHSNKQANPMAVEREFHKISKEFENHLLDWLRDKNYYKRLKALQFIRTHPKAASLVQVHALTRMLFDLTTLKSPECVYCQTECENCSGCWGRFGHSGCVSDISISQTATDTVEAISDPLIAKALAESIWSEIMQFGQKVWMALPLANKFISLWMPKIPNALSSKNAKHTLLILMAVNPNACDAQLVFGPLNLLIDSQDSKVRQRAAMASLVCFPKKKPQEEVWLPLYKKALSILSEELSNKNHELLSELLIIKDSAADLAPSLGKYMEQKDAKKAPLATKLLGTFPKKGSLALGGLRIRLQEAYQDQEIETLFQIIKTLGPKAKSLMSALLHCIKDNQGFVGLGLDTLQAIQVPITAIERRRLKKLYDKECRDAAFEDGEAYCEPFSKLLPVK